MPSLKILFLLAVLSLAVTATANPFSSSSSCPKNWYTNTFGGMSRCCYGHMLVAGAKPDALCCVHDVVDESTTTASSGAAPSTTTDDSVSSPNSCFSKIPFSASDYSSRVSAASVMAWATTTGPSSNQASSTSTSTSTRSASGSGSGSGSSTSSGLASSTSNVALPVATAEGVVLGGAAAVIAHFVL
jgi:hypothetical protein